MPRARLGSSAVAFLAVTLLVGAVGCPGEIRDLWNFREAVAQRYGPGGVHVGVEGGRRTLSIRLSDSEHLALPFPVKTELARDVARFANVHYARSDRVDHFVVEFVEENGDGLFTTSRRVTFEFAPAELR